MQDVCVIHILTQGINYGGGGRPIKRSRGPAQDRGPFFIAVSGGRPLQKYPAGAEGHPLRRR